MKSLVVFTAAWSEASQAIAPVLTGLSVPVRQIDIEERPTLAALYGVKAVPAFVLCVGDNIVANKVGFKTIDEIESFIAQ